MTSAPVILDAAGRPAIMPVRAYYEGAQGSPLRSYLPGIVQNARKDLSRATRRELMRVSRNLWKNNPLAKAVVERLITYTVGTGIRPEPDTSNLEWNKRASEVFSSWADRADLTSRQSLWKLQEIAFRSMLVDGDVFTLLTYGASGRPRIQLVEADQCGTQGGLVQGKDDDGVISDSNGRPVAYRFHEPASAAQPSREVTLPADGVVQFANIERPGQSRGVCLAAAALTTAIDLHDILGLEKAAVKDASSKVDIIKTATGELPPRPIIGASVVAPVTTAADVSDYYQKVFGPESRVLKHGDEYTPYEPKRPGPAWTGFVDFLAELVCLSYNLPPSLVRQLKVGGADTRRDLAIMQRVVECWQVMLAHGWQRVYEYVIESEIEDGALVGAPRDWRRVDWQFPRAATVDAGRTAQQDRDDIRTGNMTLREGCGQYGVSWRNHVRQLAIEMRAVMDAEAEQNLPPGSLVNRLFAAQGSPLVPDARSAVETYGAGVRSGSITPNVEDEVALRTKLNLPPVSDAVKKAWEKDGGARSPITLASQKETEAEIEKLKDTP